MNLKYFLIALVCYLAGMLTFHLFDEDEARVSIDKQYGSLRLPLLQGCRIPEKSNLGELVSDIELVSFDLHPIEDRTSKFLLVRHKGYPSEVLNSFKEFNSDCWNNSKLTFSSRNSLLHELADSESKINGVENFLIIKQNGSFVAFFNSKANQKAH